MFPELSVAWLWIALLLEPFALDNSGLAGEVVAEVLCVPVQFLCNWFGAVSLT
jgi:hypothetical protein